MLAHSLFWERKTYRDMLNEDACKCEDRENRKPTCDDGGFATLWNDVATSVGLPSVDLPVEGGVDLSHLIDAVLESAKVRDHLDVNMEKIMKKKTNDGGSVPIRGQDALISENFEWLRLCFEYYNGYLEGSLSMCTAGVEETPRSKIGKLVGAGDHYFKDFLRRVHLATPDGVEDVKIEGFRTQESVLAVAFMMAFCGMDRFFLGLDNHWCRGCHCPCGCVFRCCSHKWESKN